MDSGVGGHHPRVVVARGRQGSLNRRGVLRGLGVALTLPWLESLAPRTARGQLLPSPKRFLPIFFPNGASTYWWPLVAGQGDAWQLPPVLEPLTPLKQHVTVLGNIENKSCGADGGASLEGFYHSLSTAAYLTCRDAQEVSSKLNVGVANGVSIDQVLAQRLPRDTPIDSLQLGLSTTESYCDGRPCAFSRCISWRTETEPLLRVTDPRKVFDMLVTGPSGPAAPRQGTLDKSVIDAVLSSAKALDSKLSSADKARLDRYLTSLRGVEQRLPSDCDMGERPTLEVGDVEVNGPGYDRSEHFDVMNELMALAFTCDSTRIISFMIDDGHSDFLLDNVPLRNFTPQGSTPANFGTCPSSYSAMHHGGESDQYATVDWYFVSKVSELCQQLASVDEGDGSLLDHTVVQLGTGFHGPGTHSTDWLTDLPLLLIGGGGAGLHTNQYVRYPDMPGNRPLRDLYYTFATRVFGVDLDSFGFNVNGAPLSALTEILKT